jgi:hypothetical protein
MYVSNVAMFKDSVIVASVTLIQHLRDNITVTCLQLLSFKERNPFSYVCA